MSRTGRAAKGFVTSVFQFIAQMLVQILLAPVVLKVAGRETLGAYAAVMQVLGFIALTDFMGALSLERFLGQASGLDDGGQRFRHVFTTVRTMFIFCVSAYSLLTIIYSFFVARIFHLSPPVARQAQYALWVIAIWVVVRMPFAAYSNASTAMQDMAAVNLISACINISRAVTSLVFVLLGGGLFGLMISGAIVEGLGYVFFRMRFKKLNPHLMPSWGIPDKALFKEMLGFNGHNFVMNMGNALVFSSGNMIAGISSGAAAASTFYTTQTPTMMAYNAMKRFSDSATPAVNELWGRGDVEKLRNALLRITRLLMALTLPLSVGALLFNRDVVITWVGPRQYAGTLLTVSVAVWCVVASIQRVAIDYSFVFGWMRLLTVTSILQGIANFALAFFLAKMFGLGGIMLALTIVVLPQTVILWYKVGQFLKVNVVALYAECFLRASVPLSTAAFVSWEMIHRFARIRQHAVLPLIAEILSFTVVYGTLAYPFMLLEHDREQIKRYSRNVANRIAGQKLFRFTES
jgi:O-antigen/teichoic acid export membrane protein